MRRLIQSIVIFCLLVLPATALDLPKPIGSYQAYAINPASGAFGFAYGYESFDRALREARNGCGGQNCRIVYSGQGRCMALFASGTGTAKRYGAHWGNTRADAERFASQQCQRFTGRVCTKVHSACEDL